MSATHRLYCKDTKKSVWIGQGHGVQFYLYNTETEINQLHDFLRDHMGKSIVFDYDSSQGEYDDYYERENWIDERRELIERNQEIASRLYAKLARQAMIIRWFSQIHKFKNDRCPWCESKSSHKDDCLYQKVIKDL